MNANLMPGDKIAILCEVVRPVATGESIYGTKIALNDRGSLFWVRLEGSDDTVPLFMVCDDNPDHVASARNAARILQHYNTRPLRP